MSETVDVLYSGNTRSKVIYVGDKTILTTLSKETNIETAFVLSTDGNLKIEDEFLSYAGLKVLADISRYKLVDINQTTDLEYCSYCGKQSPDIETYIIDTTPVFYGHQRCLEKFCKEVGDIVEEGRKYVVSSEI